MSGRASTVDEQAIGQVGEVAALYARCAGLVRGQVRLEVAASEAGVDDAGQFAWVRLLHLRPRVRRDKAISCWITTALHEAFKRLRRDGYELSLEEVMEETDDLRISRSAPAP